MDITFEHRDTAHLKENITIIAEHTRQFTGAERCSVFVYDKEHDQLKTIYADGIHGSLALKSNVGLVGYAFHKKQSIIENDTSNSELFFKAVDKKLDYHTQTILSVPVIGAGGNRLGVIQLLNKPRGFETADKELVEEIAHVVVSLLDPESSHETEEKKDTTVAATLQEKLDRFLEDKKLFLMEDGSAYYKVVGMEREYFIAADACYQLTDEAVTLKLYYYTMDEEFLYIEKDIRVEREVKGLLVGTQPDDFRLYALEKDAEV